MLVVCTWIIIIFALKRQSLSFARLLFIPMMVVWKFSFGIEPANRLLLLLYIFIHISSNPKEKQQKKCIYARLSFSLQCTRCFQRNFTWKYWNIRKTDDDKKDHFTYTRAHIYMQLYILDFRSFKYKNLLSSLILTELTHTNKLALRERV